MRRLLFICAVLILFVITKQGYALEWQKLHNQADKITLDEASSSVRKNNDSIEDLYVLGLVNLNLHKDEQAKEVFEKVLSVDPKTIEAKWGVAEVLRRQHKPEESEKIVVSIIKERPDFSPAYITLAYIRYFQMRFNDSVRLANKVLAQGEKKVDLSNHVRAHLMLGGSKGMIAHYGGPISKIINGTAVLPNLRRAEEKQPDSAAVLFGLGSFYLLSPSIIGGDLDQAEKYFKKGIEADPLFADIYVRLGQLYQLKGDEQKYEFYLNKALEIDPQNELALDIKSRKCKFICIPDRG
ncbi:MAG: hypothetical protein KJ880_00975 [Candidatus Omnitrophica bacterium]|nr:hypothetical protein [Candidatus Omnitrophota bacterium]MBU1869115.1 hypothetical protein [Candidatus Omnitrophota bacterium]